MKLVTFILFASIVSTSQAQTCLGEAQIISKIKFIEYRIQFCRAFIDLSEVRHFSESMVCPLDLSEIATKGVDVTSIDGHDCPVAIGEELNGVVVKLQNGKLRLE